MIRSGVIEGFFGRDWGWAARHRHVAFLAKTGFDFYVYAPKGEAYLRRQWREPMPAGALDELRRLSAQCHREGLRFGVGLSPYEIYRDYDAAARSALRAKVLELDAVGLDLLCILFDDMRGDLEGVGRLQASIVADVVSWSAAREFIVCPTYYSSDPSLTALFGTPPMNYLKELGRLLDPAIDIFWTGEHVISSSYSATHLEMVSAQLRRKPFIWDNHVANDARIRSQHLYLDAPTQEWQLPAASVAGLAINPMNQPALSQIALSAYAALLKSPIRTRPTFAQIAHDICGQTLAQRLVGDLRLLQTEGLGTLDGSLCNGMRGFYEAEGSTFSQEICAFLRGEYRFDPACLTN